MSESLVDWLVDSFAAWMTDFLVSCLAAWLLVAWLLGWLAG